MSTTATPSTPDAATADTSPQIVAITRSLELLHEPGTVFEVRSLGVPGGKGFTSISSGYFDDFNKAATYIALCDRRRPKGTYATVSPCQPALLARANNRIIERAKTTTADTEIVRRRWLPFDIDPHRPSGIAATHDEVDLARRLAIDVGEILWTHGWPVPLSVDSGNGMYLLFRVDLPNDAESLALIKSCYAAVNHLLGGYDPSKPHATLDTTVGNAAQILRIGGTTNRKGDPTADRPHRLCEYHEPDPDQPIEVVPIEALRKLAALAPSSNGQQTGSRSSQATSANGSNAQRSRLVVDQYLADHGIQYTTKADANRTIYKISSCPFDQSHGSNGESAVVQRADGMVCYECKHNSCQGRKWQDFRDAIGKPDPIRHYDPPLPSTSKATAKPLPAIAPGTIVKPTDRNNFGDVVEDKGVGCDVHFRSEDGNNFTKYFLKSDLRYQDGRPIVESESVPFEMNVYTAAELDRNSFEITYLVDGILVAGQPAILAGMMKTLKTTLLVALAVALVLGRKFLGLFDVPQAVRVGLVSGESGLAVLQETFRRICIAYDVALADLDGLVVSDTIPRLENPACIGALAGFCRTNKLDVLILDPAYLMMSGLDAGNVFSMGEKLAALNILAADAKVTVILAHHLRKNRPGDFSRFAPPDLEEIAWSGFCEFARQWCLVGRRSGYADGSGFHDLWLKVGGSAGHNSLWALDINEGHRTDPGGRCWEVEAKPGGEVIQQAKQERSQRQQEKRRDDDKAGQDAIVKALSTLPRGEGAFKFKLRATTGISNERLARLLEQLRDQKIVEPCSALRSPTHKTPQAGAYRLTDDWWNDD